MQVEPEQRAGLKHVVPQHRWPRLPQATQVEPLQVAPLLQVPVPKLLGQHDWPASPQARQVEPEQ